MTHARFQRAVRNIGGLAGSTSRPPLRLPEPDLRPGITPATRLLSNVAIQESNATTQTIKLSPSTPANNVVAKGGVVIVVCTKSTQSVASITNTVGGGPAGFTLSHTYTAQGRKMAFYEQRFAAAQTNVQWTVTVTPSLPFAFADRWYMFAYSTTASSGPVIRAITDASAATSTSLTFSSLSYPYAGHIITQTYSFGAVTTGLNVWRTTSPLTAGSSVQFTFASVDYGWYQGAQPWISSAATGTRTHAVTGTGNATGLGSMFLL